MKIDTKLLGEVEIEEKDILTFEFGLPGFPEIKKFALLPLDTDLPIAVLQSIEETALGFIVAFPYAFKNDYAFDISEEDLIDLQIEKEEDILVYSIVTLKESFNDSTLNLLAPVILNINKNLGKQIVLQDSGTYPIRFPVSAYEGSAK